MAWRWFHQWGSPRWFYERASRWQAWAGWIAVILLAVGTVWGLAIAPVDYQQGHSYRIIYLHVPVSFLAQALYLAMAIAAAVLLVWRMKLADVAMQSLAIVGFAFCVLALASGAIWGNLLGVGCAPDLNADSGLSVFGHYWLAFCDVGPKYSRESVRNPRSRWSD
jgi:heme exporter protein C